LKELAASMEAFSHSFTSYGMLAAPMSGEIDQLFVTLPAIHFEENAEHVFAISYSNALWTAPVVRNATLWQEYSKSYSNGSALHFNSNMFVYGELPLNTSDGSIKMGKLPVSGDGPFTPITQLYPSPPSFVTNINGSIINYDTSSDMVVNATNTFVNILRDKPVLSGLIPKSLFRDAYPETLNAVEPISLFVQPIHSDFSKTKIVAYIQSIFEWEFLFSEIPYDGDRVLCYVENTCGDSFAFTLHGDSVDYNGIGDPHYKTFDEYSKSSIVGLQDSSEAGLQDALTAGVCVYTLTIYPTPEFRNSFNSNADVYAFIVGTTMTFMVATFFIYDQ
jgi:hypothetical protein